MNQNENSREKNHPVVLIIDDMVINQMFLSSQLSALGVSSDAASGGMEGLKLYKDKEYDLVLLDKQMPDMDGFATFEKLKEIFGEEGRRVPVICETADESAEAAIALKEAGFDEVLVKPLDFMELHDMLKRQLGDRYTITEPEIIKTQKDKLQAEIELLPEWVRSMEELDIRYGLEHCGEDADEYMDALAIFAASVDDKAKDVRQYLEEGESGINVLRLHSLKSSARLIGALSLAEQAAALEFAGKVGNLGALRSGTEALISHYKELEEKLKQHLSGTDSAGKALPPISDQTLKDAFALLNKAIDEQNLKDVDMVISDLGEYSLKTEDAVRYQIIKRARRKEDWDVLKLIIE